MDMEGAATSELIPKLYNDNDCPDDNKEEEINDCQDDRNITNSVRVNITRDATGDNVEAAGYAGEVINDCPDDRNIINSVRVNIARDANGDNVKAAGEAGKVINDCPDDRNIINSVRVNITRDAKGDNVEAAGEASLAIEVDGAGEALEETEVQRDLSESFPGLSPTTTRESKSQKMRMKREAFKELRRTKTCKRQPKVKMMSSKDVPNDLIKDRSIPYLIIG